jgi:nitrate/nitrite transporter NarK
MIVGLALAAFLIAEVYLDVVYVFGAGRVMLAFAIALEACSRALGTVAAARAGERAWACACAIIGAPAVLWFALARRSERAEVEPAPLAGLLAGLAGLLGVIALLTGA